MYHHELKASTSVLIIGSKQLVCSGIIPHQDKCINVIYSLQIKKPAHRSSFVHSAVRELKMSETFLFRWAKPSLNCSTGDYRISMGSSSSMTFGCSILNLLNFSGEIKYSVCVFVCTCSCMNMWVRLLVCVQVKFYKVVSRCVYSSLCAYCDAADVFRPVSPRVNSGRRCLITL